MSEHHEDEQQQQAEQEMEAYTEQEENPNPQQGSADHIIVDYMQNGGMTTEREKNFFQSAFAARARYERNIEESHRKQVKLRQEFSDTFIQTWREEQQVFAVEKQLEITQLTDEP
eukprot:GILK01009692.1.p1 GENE.GILK01009692.1~~GILK01009692.1.p1  ORF type:complete len:130 (+),score=32.45 GILK01009692.1:46-390(+)